MTNFAGMVSATIRAHRQALLANIRGTENLVNRWSRMVELRRWTRTSEFRCRQREWASVSSRDRAWFCARLWEATEQ